MKNLLFIACCGLLFTSCATQQKPLYNWGNYQSAVYKYVKNSTDADAEALLNAYQYVIDNPTGSLGTVPPGVYADYGYLLVKRGQVKEGIEMMKMEVALYPESAEFVNGLIKRLE